MGSERNVYYVDLENGCGDGLSECNPRGAYVDLMLQPGDTILFKRGTSFYGQLLTQSGAVGAPIVYGAYGEGEKPVFHGSIDVSNEENWENVGENLWKCIKPIPKEACNFIFAPPDITAKENGCGTLRWSLEELKKQGDWMDNRMGSWECCKEKPKGDVEQNVIMYSVKNPALYYEKVECACRDLRALGELKDNIIIENICFKNNGVHGLAGRGENIIVRNCDFIRLGGCVWSKELKIRFGNGVEFWNISRSVEVTDCFFYDIYDSGVTHQGFKCEVTENSHFDRNIFMRCGMAAYEARDLVPRNTTFNENICVDAGEGFSQNGVVMPRKSEIWPQPMGHHVFIWRMEHATPQGSLQIKRNVFYNAPYGAGIYSIAAKDAEAQFEIDENIYYTENGSLLNHLDGKNYAGFEQYCVESGRDKNGRYEKIDILKALSEIREKGI